MKMTSTPKVLVFIDWFTPGFRAGGPIRSCLNAMHHLKNDIEFYVVCSDKDYLQKEPYINIEYEKWNEIEDNIHVRYLRDAETTKQVFLEIIRSDSFSAIHINGVYSAKFSILPLRAAKMEGIPIIISARGMLKDSAIAVKKLKKTFFLQLAKMTGLYRNVIFHATNEEEKRDIWRRVGQSTRIKVAPNLTKVEFIPSTEEIRKESGLLKIVSLARISPEKNLNYALTRLSEVKSSSIELDIYGAKYNLAYWTECETLINSLDENIVVRYKGIIHPDSIDEMLQKYHLMFLPTQGENFGHVIIESLRVGTPVLISDQTPWRNLQENRVGYDLPLADKPGFVRVLEEIAKMDQSEYDKLRESCLIFAKNQISDSTAVALNKQLFVDHD